MTEVNSTKNMISTFIKVQRFIISNIRESLVQF